MGPRVRGARFLDVFSGSGAIGIEAFSRGAGKVVLVESDRTALAVLTRNLEALGIRTDIEVVRSPWPRAIRQAESVAGPFDIAFADPPYATADYPAILESLSGPPDRPGPLARDGLIVLEHEDRAEIPPEGGGFGLQRRAVYGRVAFGFYRPKA